MDDIRKMHSVGEKLTLTYSEDDNNSFMRNFKIVDYLGSGGSGVVYLVKYTETKKDIVAEHSGILKEFNPINTEYGSERYKAYKKRFLESYKLQTEFHSKCDDAKNITCNTEGIYEGNNKIYIMMSCDKGISYNKTKKESLLDILKTTLAITKALKVYHDNGYLHLDLKPDNILILNETKEIVKLFDFDSICKKSEILSSDLLTTKEWRAPETYLEGKRNKICEATDLYSVGCIVFKKVFGRFPSADDRTKKARYDFSNTEVDFNNVKSTIFESLRSFFNKTLQSTVKNRYQSADEVIAVLEELIEIAENRIPRLGTISWSASPNNIGREEELLEIDKRLKRDGVVFIHGMGGIGKSELAKMYSEKYKNKYIARQFISYYSEDNSKKLDNVISKLVFEGKDSSINNFDESYRKFQMLDDRSLIIIDNFNTSYDEYIENIITNNSNGPRIIFTTRDEYKEYSDKFLNLGTLKKENSIDLFYKFYERGAILKKEYDPIIRRILVKVQYNTLLIKLIASTLEESEYTPEEILNVLNDSNIKSLEDEVIHKKDIKDIDDTDNLGTIYEHLMKLFKFSKMNSTQKNIMRNLSFLGITRVKTKVFMKWCNISNRNEINKLIRSGWIQIDKTSNMIYLHQVIADLAYEELGKQKLNDEEEKNIDNFIENIMSEKNISTFLLDIIQSKIVGNTKHKADICNVLYKGFNLNDDRYLKYCENVLLGYSNYMDDMDILLKLEKVYISVTRKYTERIARENCELNKCTGIFENFFYGYLNLLRIMHKEDLEKFTDEIINEIEYISNEIYYEYGVSFTDDIINNAVIRIFDTYFECGLKTAINNNEQLLRMYKLREVIFLDEVIPYWDSKKYNNNLSKIEELNQIIKKEEKQIRYKELLKDAKQSYKDRRYSDAIEEYDELLEYNNSPEIINNIIDIFIERYCFNNLKSCEAAIEYVQKLIEYLKVEKSIAQIYSEYYAYEKMRSILKIKKDRINFEKYKNEVYELFKNAEYEQAEIQADKAIKYIKTYADVEQIYLYISKKYSSVNNKDKQIEYILKFVNCYTEKELLCPEDNVDLTCSAYWNIAEIYKLNNDMDNAFEYYKKSVILLIETNSIKSDYYTRNTEKILSNLQKILKICEEFEYIKGIEYCLKKINSVTLVQQGIINE